MSTRSRICIIKNDGTARSIYCHYDGYLNCVGQTLKNNYKDEETILKLMDIGDISSLGINPTDKDAELFWDPGYWLSHKEEVAKICMSYRARKEEGVDSIDFSTEKELLTALKEHLAEEFNYIFKNGIWYYSFGIVKVNSVEELETV